MPKIENDPRFLPSYTISKQLDKLIIDKKIDLSTATDLSIDEIDFLLNHIRIKSHSKETLMSIVDKIKINSNNSLYDIKVKVLLDNLAKKMCRCVSNVTKKQIKPRCIDLEKCKPLNSEHAICRTEIFHNRNIDFYTYSCDKDGPILYPKKNTKQILHRKTN